MSEAGAGKPERRERRSTASKQTGDAQPSHFEARSSWITLGAWQQSEAHLHLHFWLKMFPTARTHPTPEQITQGEDLLARQRTEAWQRLVTAAD